MAEITRITASTVDVLRMLTQAESPVWGLLIIKETGRAAGTVYPILDRLESFGWVESSWEETQRSGPRRRLYRLTDDGSVSAAEVLNAYKHKLAERRAKPAARTSQQPSIARSHIPGTAHAG